MKKTKLVVITDGEVYCDWCPNHCLIGHTALTTVPESFLIEVEVPKDCPLPDID